jgi:hypothetical protein
MPPHSDQQLHTTNAGHGGLPSKSVSSVLTALLAYRQAHPAEFTRFFLAIDSALVHVLELTAVYLTLELQAQSDILVLFLSLVLTLYLKKHAAIIAH